MVRWVAGSSPAMTREGLGEYPLRFIGPPAPKCRGFEPKHALPRCLIAGRCVPRSDREGFMEREFELIERMRGDRDHLSAACSPGLVLQLFIRPLRSLKVGALSRFRQMRC